MNRPVGRLRLVIVEGVIWDTRLLPSFEWITPAVRTTGEVDPFASTAILWVALSV